LADPVPLAVPRAVPILECSIERPAAARWRHRRPPHPSVGLDWRAGL